MPIRRRPLRSFLQPVRSRIDRSTFRPVREKIDIRSDIIEGLVNQRIDAVLGSVQHTNRRVDELHEAAYSLHEAVRDQVAILGMRLGKVEVDARVTRALVQPVQPAVERVSEAIEDLLSPSGSMQASDHRSVRLDLVEWPFALRALAAVAPGSRALVLGGGGSTLGLQLASLGYRTTVIERDDHSLRHPYLRVTDEPLDRYDGADRFDVVVRLSGTEGCAGEARSERAGDGRDGPARPPFAQFVTEGGHLILTAELSSLDASAGCNGEALPARWRLERLLAGWDVVEAHTATSRDQRTWVLHADELLEGTGPGAVALVVARRTPDISPEVLV